MPTLLLGLLAIGGLGPWEIALILLVILLVFGAKRIPEIARGLGKGIREFKDATNEISKELQSDPPKPPQQIQQPPQQTYAAPPQQAPAPQAASPQASPPQATPPQASPPQATPPQATPPQPAPQQPANANAPAPSKQPETNG